MSSPGLVSNDSMDKIKHYLLMISKEPLWGMVPPNHLAVSHTFWRDYTCPPGCGGCCKPFSMDLWPEEFEKLKQEYPERSKSFKECTLPVFGTMYSNKEGTKERWGLDPIQKKCEFLDGVGRCGIYTSRPFSCRFELNKINFNKSSKKAILGKRLFGRGWSYIRIDGGKGAMCEMLDLTPEILQVVIERDLPLVEYLVVLANRLSIKNKGEELLAVLYSQKEILLRGDTIKPMTLVGETNKVISLSLF